MSVWAEIDNHISTTVGRSFNSSNHQSVGGGCINQSCVIADQSQRFFVKTNAHIYADMFAAEAEGLLELAKSAAIKVPEPICWGVAEDSAYLVLEYIDFGAHTERASAALGAQLARLHRFEASQFGWYRDNTIGLTRQVNTYRDSWSEFWRVNRLGVQRDVAVATGQRGTLIEKLERVIDAVPVLLSGHYPRASLLHGDLWSGNFAADNMGRPVIFDPAVYFGDRETDLAMTELFGGFGSRFYQAYKSEYPIPAGYGVRKTLYNLYHVMNHLNLFGGGYARQAERMLDELISEAGA